MAGKIGGGKLTKKAESTRSMKTSLKEQIKNIIIQGNNDISSINKKIILTGENGTSKSSLSLALLTHDIQLPEKVPLLNEKGKEVKDDDGNTIMVWPEEDLKDHDFIFYIDIDNSGHEIAEIFFKDYIDTRRVILWNPVQTTSTEEGATIVDRGETVSAIATAAATLQDMIAEGYKVKAVIIDGISFVLQYCEAFMRDEKGLGADEGAKHQVWKIRNDKFREFKDPFMALPLTVIFIGHEDFIPEYTPADQNFALVKQKLIDECSMRIILTKVQDPNNTHIQHYLATIKKDRSNVLVVDKDYIFMSVNNKKNVVETDHDKIFDAIFPT